MKRLTTPGTRISFCAALAALAMLFPPAGGGGGGNGGAARADTVYANATVDLDTAVSGNTWNYLTHPLDNPVRVYSGDTVVLSLDFLANQILTWNSDGGLRPWLSVDYFNSSWQQGPFAWADTSVTFHNLTQGTQLTAAQMPGGGSSSVHLGPALAVNDNVVRTFSGMSVSFTATFTDGDAYRDYPTLFPVNIFAGTVTAGLGPDVNAVPLPAAAWGGLAVMGAVASARRLRAGAS